MKVSELRFVIDSLKKTCAVHFYQKVIKQVPCLHFPGLDFVGQLTLIYSEAETPMTVF